MYTTKLDAGVRSLPPHREMLRCPFAVVAGVSGRMASVVRGVYGIDAPGSLFLQAVQVFRLAQAAIDSRSCGLRRRVDYLRPLGLSSAYVNALSHVDSPRSFTPFANEEHAPWPSAFEGGVCVDGDFEGLYQSAFQRALRWLPRFAGGDFDESDCRAMVGGVDFRGATGISFLDTSPTCEEGAPDVRDLLFACEELAMYLCPRRRISFDGFVSYEGRRFGVPYWYPGKTCRIGFTGALPYASFLNRTRHANPRMRAYASFQS